jgi:hypothetical protein
MKDIVEKIDNALNEDSLRAILSKSTAKDFINKTMEASDLMQSFVDTAADNIDEALNRGITVSQLKSELNKLKLKNTDSEELAAVAIIKSLLVGV